MQDEESLQSGDGHSAFRLHDERPVQEFFVRWPLRLHLRKPGGIDIGLMHLGKGGKGEDEIGASNKAGIVYRNGIGIGIGIGTVEGIEPSFKVVFLEDRTMKVEAHKVQVYHVICDAAISR